MSQAAHKVEYFNGGNYLQDPDEPQHQMLTSFTPRGKAAGARNDVPYGKLLRVRCKCMAEYKNVSDRYFTFDWLGDVTSLAEARALYDHHLYGLRVVSAPG